VSLLGTLQTAVAIQVFESGDNMLRDLRSLVVCDRFQAAAIN
jgi:hypothetical protein